MRVKLEDVCERGSSNVKQSDIPKNKGLYEIYGASGLAGKVDFYHRDKPYVAVVKDGAGIGRTMFLHGKTSVIGTLQYLIPKDNILPKYLYYVVKYMNLSKYFTGATIPHIYYRDYKNEEFNLSSIDDQKTIVNQLEALECIIELRTEDLKKLDELVKARFVEMFGNYKMEKAIGEVATICRGASPRPISKFITESNGENWIKIGDVKEDDIFITKTKELVTEDGANRSRRIKPGDFILSNSMSFGRPYISKIYGCVHDGWLIISDYEQSFLPLFFYYAIRSELVQAQFRKSVAGAVVKNLNSDLVRSVKIVIPSIESQEKFASFVAQVDKSKFTLSNELAMGNFYIRLIHDCIMHGCIDL